MVGMTGFAPAAARPPAECSAPELHPEKWLRIQVTLLGLPGQSRPRYCYANPQ